MKSNHIKSDIITIVGNFMTDEYDNLLNKLIDWNTSFKKTQDESISEKFDDVDLKKIDNLNDENLEKPIKNPQRQENFIKSAIFYKKASEICDKIDENQADFTIKCVKERDDIEQNVTLKTIDLAILYQLKDHFVYFVFLLTFLHQFYIFVVSEMNPQTKGV